jgi:hypothetical protein
MLCSSGSTGIPNNLVSKAITGPTGSAVGSAKAGETFHGLGCLGDASGGIGHLDCDVLGPGAVSRGKEVRQASTSDRWVVAEKRRVAPRLVTDAERPTSTTDQRSGTSAVTAVNVVVGKNPMSCSLREVVNPV